MSSASEDLRDERLGQSARLPLIGGALLGRREVRVEGIIVQVRDRVLGKVAVDDCAVRVGGPPGLRKVLGERSAARFLDAHCRVDVK